MSESEWREGRGWCYKFGALRGCVEVREKQGGEEHTKGDGLYRA